MERPLTQDRSQLALKPCVLMVRVATMSVRKMTAPRLSVVMVPLFMTVRHVRVLMVSQPMLLVHNRCLSVRLIVRQVRKRMVSVWLTRVNAYNGQCIKRLDSTA